MRALFEKVLPSGTLLRAHLQLSLLSQLKRGPHPRSVKPITIFVLSHHNGSGGAKYVVYLGLVLVLALVLVDVGGCGALVWSEGWL